MVTKTTQTPKEIVVIAFGKKLSPGPVELRNAVIFKEEKNEKREACKKKG
jgi:hypothetical protein